MRRWDQSVYFGLVCALALFYHGQLHAGVTYNIPPGPVPASLGSGDVINLGVGGSLPDSFHATGGSTINVNGGSIGILLRSAGTVNLNSGSIAYAPAIIDGGIMNVYGGTVAGAWQVSNGSQVNIHGGVLADTFGVINNSTIRMTGGVIQTFTPLFIVNRMTVFEMSGGSAGMAIQMEDGTAKLTGTSFLKDGLPIPGLTPGSTVTFDGPTAAGSITGTLLDGKPVTLNMDPYFDHLGPWAYHVSVTLVPEPGTWLVGVVGVVGVVQLRTWRGHRRV